MAEGRNDVSVALRHVTRQGEHDGRWWRASQSAWHLCDDGRGWRADVEYVVEHE
jgi:hypothetical protein